MVRLPRKFKKECKKLLCTYYDDALILKHNNHTKLSKHGKFIMKYIAPCFDVGYYDDEDWQNPELYHPCKKHVILYSLICLKLYNEYKRRNKQFKLYRK